jgi:AraC-like DNA-binding protein
VFAEAVESVRVVRLVAGMAGAGGVDARQLAAEAGVQEWALGAAAGMVCAGGVARLWELAEEVLADPVVGLGAAARCEVGELGLFDYLVRTAGTLRDGLEAFGRYLPLVTTGGRLRVLAGRRQEMTYCFSYPGAGGRGRELAVQFWVGLLCGRARAETGRAVAPAHAGLAQDEPRCPRAFAEMLGTDRVDFGTPATTITYRESDLDLPMRAADPALAAILRSFGATLPQPVAPAWQQHFRQLLGKAIEEGTPTLETLARRMSLSPRTLQRRLAEHGTTWRAELDTARRDRAQTARQAGTPTMTRLARQLGYTSPRSVRRALRRWDRASM